MLNIRDHRRDSARMTYVYPVISRRAGGVSLGINLNPNNACNWACIYCQVPNLTRGGPPPLDLALLEKELRSFLEPSALARFMAEQVPTEARQLMDLAFSGNGEPTSAHEFSAAAQLVGTVLADVGLSDIKLRLITNGSLLHRPEVQAGIAALGALHGEVWFKLDRATLAGMQAVNQINMAPEKVLSNLLRCAQLAPTWVQTCWFTRSGIAPTAAEERAYLALLVQALPNILGVHLYGLARPSCQPEAALLTALSTTELALFAQKITGLGTRTIVSA